jgi:hypothetical protein
MGAEISCSNCGESSLSGCNKPECELARYLDECDSICAELQDVLHGSEGDKIIDARCKIVNAQNVLRNMERFRR